MNKWLRVKWIQVSGLPGSIKEHCNTQNTKISVQDWTGIVILQHDNQL